MKKIALSLFLLILGFPVTVLAQNNANSEKICPSQLAAKIDAIASRREFTRSRWGILIETRDRGNKLYQKDADKYFIPASNVKLMTTAAALQTLGIQERIRTPIYNDNQGNVIIVGKGDPTITETQLQDFAKQLKNKGITQINQLIADDSYFQGDTINPHWEWEDVQSGDGAPINSLIFHQNSLELILSPQRLGQPLQVKFADQNNASQWQIENQSVTVGKNEAEFVEVGKDLTKPVIKIRGKLQVGSDDESVYVSISNPAHYFLQQFQQVLMNAGIRVKQLSVTAKPQTLTQELGIIASPNIGELVKETNHVSNNLYAGVLLRLLGKKGSVNPNLNSEEKGLEMLKVTLSQLGVNGDSYYLKDGSGLSRQNLVTPQALVQTLRGMSKSGNASIYKNSLPIAGVSGTLKNRLKNTSAEGIVYAKTGTLTGVGALSGYIDSPNYEPLIFSIIVNQSELSTAKLRNAIDDIVLILSRVQNCP
jgi:serine-type D-Ala-D-Ala carboxypeptidase/endopeptidase (penicillin-binding protein 4)